MAERITEGLRPPQKECSDCDGLGRAPDVSHPGTERQGSVAEAAGDLGSKLLSSVTWQVAMASSCVQLTSYSPK